MNMSPQEREETILGLLEAVGDDPKKRAEMELIIAQLPAMEDEKQRAQNRYGAKVVSNLKHMVQEDEIAKARETAQNHMPSSWEFFVENQEAILEATIASGQLSDEEVELFKSDKKIWLQTLRKIWEDTSKKQEL